MMRDLDHTTRRGALHLLGGAAIAAGGLAGPAASTALGAQPAFRELATPRLASVPPSFLKLPGTVRGAALPLTNWNGELVVHPTALGNWLNGLLDTYTRTGDRSALTTAAEGMDELHARATKYAGAAFAAYEFTYNGLDRWYSSFGQSKFPRAAHLLHKHTGERKYLNMREEFIEAFEVPRGAGHPWVAGVDGAGGLWLDEYPKGNHISMVFNGHIYALAELLKYWELSGDARALKLVRGALWTAWFYRHRLRRPGLHSRYYANNDAHVASYHYFNTQCYWLLHGMTNHPHFALTVDELLSDWSCDNGVGTIRVAGGRTHTVRNGSSVQQWRPASTVVTRSSTRASIFAGQGPWSRMDSGPRAGWFVRESTDAYREGYTTEQWRWLTPRVMRLGPGVVNGYAFSSNGARVLRTSVRFSTTSRASANRRVLLGGRTYLNMSDGAFKGLWIEQSQLRPA